jgi:hypothetical protein
VDPPSPALVEKEVEVEMKEEKPLSSRLDDFYKMLKDSNKSRVPYIGLNMPSRTCDLDHYVAFARATSIFTAQVLEMTACHGNN